MPKEEPESREPTILITQVNKSVVSYHRNVVGLYIICIHVCIATFHFLIIAPEIIEEAQAFPQSDIWSFGVLLYVLLSGQLPFKGDSAEETKDNTLNVKFKFEYLYKEVTMEATRLIMWIFKRSPW